MKLTIVTGLSTSGKTTYCKSLNKPTLIYDNFYDYHSNSLLFNEIKKNLEQFKSYDEIILDAFSYDYLNFICENLSITNLELIVIYTDIDEYYENLSKCKIRKFITDNNYSYNNYVEKIQFGLQNIDLLVNYIRSNFKVDKFLYIYREKSNYTQFNDNSHFKSQLKEKK
jgi:hypothetical protein